MPEINGEIKLESVTVFQTSALLKMDGNYECKKGENLIIIKDLTRKLDKNSIRIKGFGEGRILNTIIEKVYSQETNQKKVQELRDKLEDLQKIKKKLDGDLINTQNLKQEKENALKNFSNEYPKYYSIGKISIDKIKELDILFKEQISDYGKEIRKIGYEIEDINKKIDEIQRKINELGYSSGREMNSSYQVSVIIDAVNDGKFTLNLSFMVSDAKWIPFYDISIKDDKLSLELMANVFNLTGVDWVDVNLDISTASVKPVKLEKPDPLNIDHYIPVAYKMKAKKNMPQMQMRRAPARMDLMAQSNVAYEAPIEAIMDEEEEPMPEMESVTTDVSSNFGVQVYSLNTKYNLPSDKNPKPIPLFKTNLPSVKQYFWTVSDASRVLCNNKVKNGVNLILPGNAKVYVNDEYIGETYLDLIAPNEEFKVGERITYDVKVTKILKKKQKQKEGAFKGKNLMSYSYEIKIENLNKVTEELILYDRLPHSISEKIKVKLGDFSLEPARNTMNVLKYVLKLENIKEKMIISYNYDVIYEKDVNITPALP